MINLGNLTHLLVLGSDNLLDILSTDVNGLGLNNTSKVFDFDKILSDFMANGPEKLIPTSPNVNLIKTIDLVGEYWPHDFIYMYPNNFLPSMDEYFMPTVLTNSNTIRPEDIIINEEKNSYLESITCENFSCRNIYSLNFATKISNSIQINNINDDGHTYKDSKMIDSIKFLKNINDALIDDIVDSQENLILKNFLGLKLDNKIKSIFNKNLNKEDVIDIISKNEINLNNNIYTNNKLQFSNLMNMKNQNFSYNQINPIISRNNLINSNEFLRININYLVLEKNQFYSFNENDIEKLQFINDYIRDISLINIVNNENIDYKKILEKINEIVDMIFELKNNFSNHKTTFSQLEINFQYIYKIENIETINLSNDDKGLIFQNLLSNLIYSSIDKETRKINLEEFYKNLQDTFNKIFLIKENLKNNLSLDEGSLQVNSLLDEINIYLKNDNTYFVDKLDQAINKNFVELSTPKIENKKANEHYLKTFNKFEINNHNKIIDDFTVNKGYEINNLIKNELDDLIKEVSNNYLKSLNLTKSDLKFSLNFIERNTLENNLINKNNINLIENDKKTFNSNIFNIIPSEIIKSINNNTDNNIKTNYFSNFNKGINLEIVNKDELINYLHNNLLKNLNDKKTIIYLHPPELGKIKVDIEINNDKIKTIFTVENNDIKELLTKTIDTLKTNLENKGFITSEVIIKNNDTLSSNVLEGLNLNFTNSNNNQNSKNQNRKQTTNFKDNLKDDENKITNIENKSLSIII